MYLMTWKNRFKFKMLRGSMEFHTAHGSKARVHPSSFFFPYRVSSHHVCREGEGAGEDVVGIQALSTLLAHIFPL